MVDRKRKAPDSFLSDAYGSPLTASSGVSDIDGKPEHAAIKCRDTKYNWRGLQLRRKSTQRQERRREQKKAKLNAAETSPSMQSYRPIAAKANTASHLTPIPLGRSSRSDSSKQPFGRFRQIVLLQQQIPMARNRSSRLAEPQTKASLLSDVTIVKVRVLPVAEFNIRIMSALLGRPTSRALAPTIIARMICLLCQFREISST